MQLCQIKNIRRGVRKMIELCDTTNTLLENIEDKRLKRNDIAWLYAMALNSTEDTDWKKVNYAIIDRWSMSGLKYIKELAWRS